MVKIKLTGNEEGVQEISVTLGEPAATDTSIARPAPSAMDPLLSYAGLDG